MKVAAFAALALLTASLHASASPQKLSVVIDTDGPVGRAEESARVREFALADIERLEKPLYYTLSARALDAVPASAAERLRGMVFAAAPPPTYDRVSLSFVEATGLLAKNESTRDAVIRRECAASRDSGCPSGVLAAATALVEDTEASSAAKLQHLPTTFCGGQRCTCGTSRSGFPRWCGANGTSRKIGSNGDLARRVRPSPCSWPAGYSNRAPRCLLDSRA